MRKNQLLFRLFFLTMISLGISFLLPQFTFASRVQGLISEFSLSDGVIFRRLSAYSNAIETWYESNVFFGTGLGLYSSIMHKKFNYLNSSYDSLITLDSMVNSYNQYLQLLVEIGILGLIVALTYFHGLYRDLGPVQDDLNKAYGNTIKFWFGALLIFNQTAVWLLPGSLVLVFVVTGLALAAVEVQVYDFES